MGRELYFSFRFCSYFSGENNVWLQNGMPCLEEGRIIVGYPWSYRGLKREPLKTDQLTHFLFPPNAQGEKGRWEENHFWVYGKLSTQKSEFMHVWEGKKRKNGETRAYFLWAFLVQQHIFDATDFSQAHQIPVCIHPQKENSRYLR